MAYNLASKVISVNMFTSEGKPTDFFNDRFPVQITTPLVSRGLYGIRKGHEGRGIVHLVLLL